ncbi:MAG: GrpB family protein [Planctomycetota bacterium]
MRLVPYQADWPEHFEREAGRLRSALGDRIGVIEHIGSTAIPGMAAKPIIDVMAAVESIAVAESMIGDVEALGYEWHPRDRADVPDRRYFVRRTPDGRRTTHHLSLAAATSAFWKRQLAFRDYLRSNPPTAEEYLQLKQNLARKYPNGRGAYVDGKNGFVREILLVALR